QGPDRHGPGARGQPTGPCLRTGRDLPAEGEGLMSRQRTWFEARRPIWMEKPGPLENALKVIALVVITGLVIYPFWTVIATSLADRADIARQGGLVLIPANPSFDAYRILLDGGIVTKALAVSIGITVVGTAVNLVMTIAFAYALSRPSTV